MNYGNVGPITYRLDVYDGDTGRLAGSSPTQNLAAGGWFESRPYSRLTGSRTATRRVVRVSGTSLLIAYGVVNDGAGAGSGGTNDGSYVAILES